MKTYLRSTLAATGMALVAFGGLTAAAQADGHITNVNVTFLLVNDLDSLDDPNSRGGFAKTAGAVSAERGMGGNVVYVHAGDMISPSLLSGFDQGAHTVEMLNIVPPDIFVPGNHEFDFGPDVFRTRVAEINSTILAANLRDESGQPIEGIDDTTMLDFDGVMIGVIGLTAEDAPVKSSPGDLQIAPSNETAQAKAAELRDAGADVVVVVAHASTDVDQAMFDSGSFDLILTGDDHDLRLIYNGRTAMAESYEQGEFVTAVDLAITVEVEDGDRDVDWWPNFRVIDTENVTADPATAEMETAFEEELSKELDVVIGTTKTVLDSRRASVRSQETTFGNLVADAMRAAVGADIAITNGGGIRGNKEYPVGTEISRRDILTELPFGNSNILLEISGAGVKAALENGVSRVEDGSGRFPQVSGLTFDVDLSMEPGSRVSNVMVGDAALDESATYKLSTNDFMGRGGDGYTVFRDANVIIDSYAGKLMANDVMAYVRQMGDVAPMVEGRINQQ